MKLDVKGIAILVALVAAVSAGSMMFTFRMFKGQVPSPAGADAAVRGEEVPVPEHIFDLRVITVNLATERGSGPYLRAAIVLQVEDEKEVEELEARRPQVRDRVIELLRQQKREDLTRPDALARLKGLVIDTVNPLLSKGRVINVFITEFVIQ